MIGLEYICELYNKKFITLANDLGISRQVVNGWIKGRRPITKKYLPVLVDMFNIPEKYFQMELDKKDEVTIQQLKLKNELITYDYEYKEFNEELKEEVTIYGSQVDQNQELEYHLLELKKDILGLHESIDYNIGKINMYEDNADALQVVQIYKMFNEILKKGKIRKDIIESILKGMKHYQGGCITSKKEVLLISEFIKRLNEKN